LLLKLMMMNLVWFWVLRPWWLRKFGKHESTVLIGFAVVMSEV
jgi:hypothetical protein